MTRREKPISLDEGLRLDALERHRITDTLPDETFDRVVEAACAALKAPVGAIAFLESERLWVKAGQGMAAPEASRDTSFCSHALLKDEVIVVEDAACDPRFAGNPAVIEQGLRFYAGAPLTTAEGFRLGTLCVMDHLPRKLSRHDRQLLRDMAAIVMGEMELRHCLGTDPLTGLYTHHFFHEVAGRELIRARREARPLAAAFVKPDDFQRRKDRLGPEAGDMVLPAIASAATRALRDSDLLGRRHEAGFVLLLPATSLRQAVPVLERLRQEIEGLVLPEWKGEQITVSIGVSELAPEDLTVSDLLTRADVALHRARGGNRLEQAA